MMSLSVQQGSISLGGCWGPQTLRGREATVCSVAGHMAERSGGGESRTTHNSPTPKWHMSLLLTFNWPHPTARGWGRTNLPCAQEKNQKSDDSLSHYHGPTLIHKVTLHVGIIMANLKMRPGVCHFPKTTSNRSLGFCISNRRGVYHSSKGFQFGDWAPVLSPPYSSLHLPLKVLRTPPCKDLFPLPSL